MHGRSTTSNTVVPDASDVRMISQVAGGDRRAFELL
jgi:hypothetical protein